MKFLQFFIGISSVLSLAACSSIPVGNAINDSHWRLQSFIDQGLSETIRVYDFCYKEKHTGFVPARDFKEGPHTVVTRITQHFNSIESQPRDAFATLSGQFESGKTYVFQNTIEDGEVTLWISNVETGQAVTSRKTVKLTVPEVVNNDSYQNRRCTESTL